MRRILTITLSTVTALVLLLSYHTSTESASVSANPMVQTPTSTATAGPTTATAPTTSPTTAPTTAPTSALTTYTGDVVQTEWGPVQVKISVRAGKITASEAVQYPYSNHRDVEINDYAVPILNQDVVQKQSASIDSVSGATVTSDGYLVSLQSAIDQAHL